MVEILEDGKCQGLNTVEKGNMTAVRIVEEGKDGRVLAKFPENKGSGIILNKGASVEVEINGKWVKLWMLWPKNS